MKAFRTTPCYFAGMTPTRIRRHDNEIGWRLSLDKLAALVKRA